MKKNYFLILLSILSFQINKTFCQKSLIEDNYSKYFKLSREIPYLHINKTSFMKGEEVWFQAYVWDLNSQKLHKNTSNLYCTIYDDKGIYKEQKLLFVENGLASGNFKIDSTYKSENYYIRAHTSYMKNFSEDESFIQKINIVQNNRIKKNNEPILNYNFQALPESGHLLVNTINTIGVVLKNNTGQGIEVKSGKIIDSKGNVVSTYSTNSFGLGKTSLLVKSNEEYSLEYEPSKEHKIYAKLPIAKSKGVVMSIFNPYTTNIKIDIKTNTKTLTDLVGKKYKLFIHNTNSYLIREIVFSDKGPNYSLYIDNKSFKRGPNIITLFNEKEQPIAERIIFNYNKNLFTEIKSSKIERVKDYVSMELLKNEKDSSKYFFSISILPKNEVSNNQHNSIISKTLLKPYIKGEIENPSYYFSKINRKKLYDLDLLLLTQGWSKYNWFNIFNNHPKENFRFEKGITVEGKLNANSFSENDIFLISNENGIFLKSSLKNNNFKFKNLFLRDKSQLSFALMESNKEKLANPKLYFRNFPKKQTQNIIFKKQNIPKKNIDKEIIGKFILNENILDEVVIKSKIKEQNSPIIINSNSTRYKIDSTYSKNQRVLDFIRNRGFIVSETSSTVFISNPPSIQGISSNNNTRVFLDGFEISSSFGENTLDIIRRTRMEEYEEIIVDRISGEIYLYSNYDFSNNDSTDIKNYTIDFGYSIEKKYYKPLYASTETKTFKKYGAIYWQPNTTIMSNENSTLLKFNHLNQEEVKVYIEGITSDGKLISLQKTISIK